jgi:PAS domain S-box-containing protein
MPDSQEQLKLYRLLVEHSLGLMCIHDLEGVLLSINPAAAQALGYTPQECLGRSIRDLLVPAVQPLFDVYLQRIQTNPSDSGLMRLRAKDGTERIWYYCNIRYDEPGALPRVLGHATDLTERIRAERALKEAQTALQQAHDDLAARVAERTAELQRANEQLRAEMEHRRQVEEELLRARKLESLGVLAGGIAHDFNNFLTVIMGNIALAKARLQAADPVGELLEQTAQACQRAVSLASQLLTFGRGGAPVRRPASLARVVSDAVELARTEAPVRIGLDVADELWPATIDAEQIGQALHNVLLNAHQAMPAGGTIEVWAENVVSDTDSLPLASGRHVSICVRDHGGGIPAEVLPRVFDPYFTTKQGGSGLGLATAHAIVAKHGGHISVQSTAGAGSTFCICLPACEEAQAPEPSEPASQALQRSGSGRILVMDDDEAIRDLLARTLGWLGYEAVCARDGAETIALYQEAKAAGRAFDTVLVDLTVPGGMGGEEVAAQLRRADRPVTLIVSSGYSDAPVMAEFGRYGFDDVLPKPWTPRQLGEVLQRCRRRQEKRGHSTDEPLKADSGPTLSGA